MEHCVLCFAWSKCLWLSYKKTSLWHLTVLHKHTQTQVNSCPIALHQVKSLLSQLLMGILGSIRFEKVFHLTLVYLLSAC